MSSFATKNGRYTNVFSCVFFTFLKSYRTFLMESLKVLFSYTIIIVLFYCKHERKRFLCDKIVKNSKNLISYTNTYICTGCDTKIARQSIFWEIVDGLMFIFDIHIN